MLYNLLLINREIHRKKKKKKNIWQWYVIIIPINLQVECITIKQLQI